MTLKEILLDALDFKYDIVYWDTIRLPLDDQGRCSHTFHRSKPAPYLKFAINLAKALNMKTVVEIGSCRLAATEKCIEYYRDPKTLVSPPCCADGHSTYFFADGEFDVHTVDIDSHTRTAIEWSYGGLNKQIPENLHMHIPHDGIEFLSSFPHGIDLLFLDGWDVGTHEYAEKHLEAYETAKDKLNTPNIILIDDTDFKLNAGGKDQLLSPRLIKDGYYPVLKGRQILYIKI